MRGKTEHALRIGPLAVLVLAFLAVGREGLETAVFFYAAVRTSQSGVALPLAGFGIGTAVAVVLALLLYLGALRFNLSKFFTITGVLLVFVAGVLAYGVHDLQEAIAWVAYIAIVLPLFLRPARETGKAAKPEPAGTTPGMES